MHKSRERPASVFMHIPVVSGAVPLYQWENAPAQSPYVCIYLLSFVLHRGIEVRALEQKIQIQIIRPADVVKFIANEK